MSLLRIATAAIAVASMPEFAADAHAQARGPSVAEVREKGLTIASNPIDRRAVLAAIALDYGLDPLELEAGWLKRVPGGYLLEWDGEEILYEETAFEAARQPEILDESGRESQLAAQAAWLQRLPGRFRIGGRVESVRNVALEFANASEEGDDSRDVKAWATLTRKVSGVADCVALAPGVGVHCLINASWPIVEPISPCSGPSCFRGLQVPDSQRVMLLRPAVMVLGLNPDTAQVVASMVVDDGVAHNWAGRLEANSLTAYRQTRCFSVLDLAPRMDRPDSPASPPPTPPPCFRPVKVVAEPDSDVVTIVLQALRVTIRLELQRDPEARAGVPEKSKEVR